MKTDFKKRGQKIEKKISNISVVAAKKTKEHLQDNLIDRIAHVRRVRIFILEWVLLIIILISLALTQAFWYRDEYAQETYTNGGTYIEATLGKVNSLNPLFASTNSERALSKLMFATLTVNDESGHVGLGLAKSITPSESGKVWTVTLKDGLKWSDGEPLTIEDVIFTAELLQDSSINSTYSTNLSGVRIEQVENSAVFTLTSSYADFDASLNIPILPKHILESVATSQLLESSFSSKPVTSGAFQYNAAQSVSTTGAKIIYLTANSNYYRGRPLLDTFAIRAYDTVEEIIEAINSGAVTATAELSALDMEKITASSTYEKQTALSSGVFAFLNTESPLLSNKSIRNAIQKGINIQEIRAHLSGEQYLDYPILSRMVPEINYPELPAYDLEEAKRLISESEIDASQPLSLVSLNTGYLPELGGALKAQLEELGFTVEFTTYEPGQDFLINIIRARNYDILFSEVEFGAEPDLFAYYHSSQRTAAGLNLSKYQNSVVDDAILSARSTLSQQIRNTRYEAILRNWVEDAPAIGIYQTNMTYVVDKDIRTFSEDNVLVYSTDRFLDVENWAVEKTIKNRTP